MNHGYDGLPSLKRGYFVNEGRPSLIHMTTYWYKRPPAWEGCHFDYRAIGQRLTIAPRTLCSWC